jgi:hypothetical protein
MPSPTPEECRKKAAECEEQAKLLFGTEMAKEFLKLAQRWRQLADDIERDELEP